MPTDLSFACDCGTLTGVLHDASPAMGCHLVCYCKDCRAWARHMGVTDALEPGGGSALFQVLPSRIDITGGADQIACKRLSDKGLFRWYASCCGTPLANTVRSSRLPLAGMWRPVFADAAPLGPVVARGFTKMALAEPGAPRRDTGLIGMLAGLLSRTARAYVAGTARQSPFFDAAGTPVAQPTVLSKAERRAAYAE